MGGLATSTVLTLLVIPVGFVFLHRLDRLFGRLGPWVVIAWAGATAAVITPLILFEQITSLTWQITTTLLVAAVFLGLLVQLFRRSSDVPRPAWGGEPPAIEARFLRKVYGQPGPVGHAWRLGERFAERVLAQGGTPFVPGDARERILTLTVLLTGALYLAVSLNTMWWRLVFSFVSAAIVSSLLTQLRRLRGKCDELGRVHPGGPENLVAFFVPWIVLTGLGLFYCVIPLMARSAVRLPPVAVVLVAIILAVVQLGRRTAKRLSAGTLEQRVQRGFLRHSRNLWRWLCRRVFGLDLPRQEIKALEPIHFSVRRGIVGILGPNGAGKTTLLRLLAGILEPSLGTVHLGGVPTRRIQRHLARWIGYLPQDFGLPGDLTGREYLEYYGLLYEIGTRAERRQRVDTLLEDNAERLTADAPTGITHVLVNGTPIRTDGQSHVDELETRPGQIAQVS